jgi:cysteine desulfurase
MGSLYYFDHNATTPVAPEVVQAMLPFLTEYWGNPSSSYDFGRQVSNHVEHARSQVAALINADPREVIFTSCGTESNNSAIHSALMLQPNKRHVLMTAVEHSANLKFAEYLTRRGYGLTLVPVNGEGELDLDFLEKAIRPDTAIVSVMWANNETGVIFPVEEVGALCKKQGVLFHTDAVQAAGKLRMDVKAAGVDMLSLSAHKLYAPKGMGMLYVRRPRKFQPYIVGGQQERGRRAGTENVAQIVAFGRAAELAMAGMAEQMNTRVRGLRDRMENAILSRIPNASRNGAAAPRLPNTSNIAFEGVESEGVLMRLDSLGICASSGSACSSGSLEPSHVLRAMGLSAARARGSIRFSLGKDTTEAETDYLLGHLPDVIQKLRGLSG